MNSRTAQLRTRLLLPSGFHGGRTSYSRRVNGFLMGPRISHLISQCKFQLWEELVVRNSWGHWPCFFLWLLALAYPWGNTSPTMTSHGPSAFSLVTVSRSWTEGSYTKPRRLRACVLHWGKPGIEFQVWHLQVCALVNSSRLFTSSATTWEQWNESYVAEISGLSRSQSPYCFSNCLSEILCQKK